MEVTEQIDIKELEKKAWKSTFQDGLWDIYFGLILLSLGFSWLGSFFGLPETVDVLVTLFSWDIGAMVLLILGKKYITQPRMGFVKFGPGRKKKKKQLAIFLGLNVSLTIMALIITMLGFLQQLFIPGFVLMLAIGLIFITLPFSTIAYFLQLNRLYLYALLGGFGLFFSELLYPITGSPINDFIIFGGVGLIITTTGLAIFIKFLNNYSTSQK